jgi:Rieske Fe-S protein
VTTGAFLQSLTSCTAARYTVVKAAVVNNEIQVPLTSLGQPGLQIVRPAGWYYDIALQKKDDNSYEALLLKCTHQDNQLSPGGNGYTCSLHGSQFDKDGHVIKGPAEHPLKQYKTTTDQDKLIIHLI